MRAKLITTAAIFLALLGFATVQMRAEIPIVQADTVFQGFGGGSVSGIVFGPPGETVILMHDAQPVEIDINTHQIVREFEKVPNATDQGYGLFILKEKGWVCYHAVSTEMNGIKNFWGLIICDYTTGKIIKTIPYVSLITNGKQFYIDSYDETKKRRYYSRYDINTLSIIDSMELDLAWFHGLPTRTPQGFGIIPNSNKIIIGANNKYLDGPAKLATLYVMDFDTKLCTEVAIPYNHNTTSSHISGIRLSETGKYYLVDLDVPKFDSLDGFNFFNNENKYLFTESFRNINEQNTNPNIGYSFENPVFISDEYVAAVVREWNNFDNSELNSYIGFVLISDSKTIKLVKFDRWWHLSYNGTDVAITNYSGTVILLNKFALPVNDDKSINFQEQAEFINGLLTFNSETTEKSDINIIDYQGNLIYTKKDLHLQAGKNSISIDFPLTNGIYFAIVKTIHGDYSYKFIVSR